MVNSVEQRQMLMDLDIWMRSSDCPFTVHFYGAMFCEGDVWICMEVMDTSMDKFYACLFKNGRSVLRQDWREGYMFYLSTQGEG